MDYKELIEELRFLSAYVPEQMCDANGKDTLEKAADAIETLLSELNALKTEWKWNYRQCNNEEK